MNFTDWFRAVFNIYPSSGESVQGEEKRAVIQTPAALQDVRPLPSGRISIDNPTGSISSNWVVVEPFDHEGTWHLRDLDVNTLDQMTPKEILDLMIDLSPEISRSVWDFQRLCNPGYEYKVFDIDPESDTENDIAKAHLDEFWGRLKEKHGSVDVILGRFFMGAFLRGAFCGELVLDSGARESLDIAAPDPYSVRFRKKADSVFKEIWEPGQWQGSDFVSLNIPTFKYIPVDPAPASPYGRPLAAPALYTSIFILSLLHDVKRVVMQQGYKRMDISLNIEAAMDAFSFDQQGFASLGEYIQGAMAALRSAYSQLQPDDALIHTDIFTINTPVGTLDSDSIGAISTILQRLEKMATRALKSNSLIMDVENSTSETDSNRRWEIHAAGVKSLQHACENMLESLLTLSLRAKGIQARVQFRFSELRAAEMFRDEQTRTMKIQNNIAERDAGFISQDEASMKTVNHLPDSPGNVNQVQDDGMLEDNNSGNESLDKGQDDSAAPPETKGVSTITKRSVALSEIPVKIHEYTNGTEVHEHRGAR